MYLNCEILVSINGQIIDSISAVDMHNDGNHIGSSCEITMPLNARIEYSGGYIIQPAKVLFNTGDAITVKAKYEGYESFGEPDGWLTIFEGFVYDFYETTPLKIKCLDYIYWFNIGIYGANYVWTKKSKGVKAKGGVGKSFTKIEFADLLQDLIDWTNENILNYWAENGDPNYDPVFITLIRPEFSFELVNISFANMSPAAVLEWLKRELGFNISLIGSQLYANIASFTRNEINLQSDINVIECNLQSTNLTKKRTRKSRGANSVFTRIKLKCYFEKEDGTKDSFEVGDSNGQLREVFFYKVDKGNLTLIDGQQVYDNYYKYAQEALNKCYQTMYKGTLEQYLYPIVNVFDKVNYTDLRYPDRDGSYVVTALDVKLDDRGFHRHLKLAPLTNFNIVTQSNQ